MNVFRPAPGWHGQCYSGGVLTTLPCLAGFRGNMDARPPRRARKEKGPPFRGNRRALLFYLSERRRTSRSGAAPGLALVGGNGFFRRVMLLARSALPLSRAFVRAGVASRGTWWRPARRW